MLANWLLIVIASFSSHMNHAYLLVGDPKMISTNKTFSEYVRTGVLDMDSRLLFMVLSFFNPVHFAKIIYSFRCFGFYHVSASGEIV